MGVRSWSRVQIEVIERRTVENFVSLNRGWLMLCDGERHLLGGDPDLPKIKRAKYVKYAIEHGLTVYAGKSNVRGKTDYMLTEKGRRILSECSVEGNGL